MVRPKGAPVHRISYQDKSKKKGQVSFKKRRKSGVLALKEIKYYSKTTNNLIPKLSLQRLVREICTSISNSAGLELKIQSLALQAIQEACETYLVQLFEDCQLAALHGKRLTIQVRDMKFVRRIRGYNDISNR